MMRKKTCFDIAGQLLALRRYGTVLTRDPVEAEELVQECLVRAYEKRASFKSHKELRPWLLSIMHNCFIDGARKKRIEKAYLALTSQVPETHQDPPQEHQIRLAQIRQNFMALSQEQRTALHLVAIEGLSYQDAATALAIPVGTLMSRLGRARAALRSIEEMQDASIDETPPARSPQLKIVGGKDDGTE